MKILHSDKEAFVKMLGFDEEERRIILQDVFQSYAGLKNQIGDANLEEDDSEGSEDAEDD